MGFLIIIHRRVVRWCSAGDKYLIFLKKRAKELARDVKEGTTSEGTNVLASNANYTNLIYITMRMYKRELDPLRNYDSEFRAPID